MEPEEQFLSLAERVKSLGKPEKITPRELFSAFGFCRRTDGNCKVVNDFLDDHELMTMPHYNDVWVDNPIELTAKEKAQKRHREDPIKRLQSLEAANNKPLTIDNSARLEEAITLMMLHDYSQLIVTNSPRSVVGSISWKSIGMALVNGVNTGIVKDYKENKVTTISMDTPLLEAIRLVYKNEFVLVSGVDNIPCGIVTIADISSQFLAWTEPFVLLEQIENQIRQLLDDKILLEDVQNICNVAGRKEVNSIDDLTFGEYEMLMEKAQCWEKLGMKSVDRTTFIKEIEEIRKIRNAIMHFDPEGLQEIEIERLRNIASFLSSLATYRKEEN